MNDRFAELRKEKGASVLQCSQETGIPASTLNSWANGKTKTLKDTNAAKLADYFGVSVDYLLGHSDTKKEASPSRASLLQEVVNLFMGLSPERKRQAMEYLRFLASADNPEG